MATAVNTEAMEGVLRPFMASTQIAPLPVALRLMTHQAVEACSRLEPKCYVATWKVPVLAAMDDGRGSLYQIKCRPYSLRVMHLTMVLLKKGQLTKGQR
jgi:hypothetical protein